MRGWLIALLMSAFISALPSVSNAQVNFKNMDTPTLVKMAQNGELVLIDETKGGLICMVTAGVLIDAPVEKVLAVVTDFEKFPEYLPQTQKVAVQKVSDSEYLVDFYLSIKFSLLKIKVDYQLKQIIESPYRVSWTQTRGEMKDVRGSWDLIPVNEKQTLALYSTSGDLKTMGRLANWILTEHPEMETAIHVSTAVLIGKATKARVETLYK
jgi:coenzyme Q-binding protein COQ10